MLAKEEAALKAALMKLLAAFLMEMNISTPTTMALQLRTAGNDMPFTLVMNFYKSDNTPSEAQIRGILTSAAMTSELQSQLQKSAVDSNTPELATIASSVSVDVTGVSSTSPSSTSTTSKSSSSTDLSLILPLVIAFGVLIMCAGLGYCYCAKRSTKNAKKEAALDDFMDVTGSAGNRDAVSHHVFDLDTN